MLKRFPSLASIIPVFALIGFLLYGWTALLTIWQVPSWTLTLTLGEILSVIAYSMTLNLTESLAALAVLLGLAFALPADYLKDEFVARGSTMAIVVLASAMIHLKLFANIDLRAQFYDSLRAWWLVTLALTAILAWLAPKNGRIKSILLGLADRTVVFMYLYLPLSLAAVIVVIARNIPR